MYRTTNRPNTRIEVADALRGKALERVRPGWHMLTTTLYAAMPTRKYVPARPRAFMDYLVESFDGLLEAYRAGLGVVDLHDLLQP